MFTISAVHRAGLGKASEFLPLQLPLIIKTFPEIAGVFPGTLNVELDVPLVVLRPDHRTEPLRWHEELPEPEAFDLLRIDFQASEGAPRIRSWLYLPHRSPYRECPRWHEVLAPRVEIPVDSRCLIHIDRDHVQLPLPYWPAALAR